MISSWSPGSPEAARPRDWSPAWDFGGFYGESVSSWLLVGTCLMTPLSEQNLLGLKNIPRQFFLQVYHTFLHIGETRYLLAFVLLDPLHTPTSAPSG